MASDDEQQSRSLSAALEPSALRAALRPSRPVFSNPWDSTEDMFACYAAVSFIVPMLLWGGGALMSSIFGFGSHWSLGVYMAAGLVGAAGFMTIVGRRRTNLSVDVLAITAWLILGVLVAPVLGLAPSNGVAIVAYAVLLVGIFAYVLGAGRWERGFFHTLSWPMTWSVLSVFFAFCAYKLILY
ncbi:MAG TPA: hypothetical protein VMD48_09805 [Solirubrobacteraceae bacterium]|nr:hypothetical protein [Solirubrobacteraceae bacterium]